MAKTAYVVTITKETTILGQENPITRIVSPKDIEYFLQEFANDDDKVKLKTVKVYE